ncbi:DUF4837 family protein [Tenacibaculum sp. 190524A02b]|uniref:DUF4837 domain-containing protein n=1 Tax=Tenacibaculum vairaonense TaxID=3137860 RepID=A0ABP1FIC7_9FLAO
MRKIALFLISILTLVSCKTGGKDTFVLPTSTGSTNKILIVVKGNDWEGKIGDEIRTVFGEHQVGLPQPETLLSVSQVDPSGFKTFMRNNKAILFIRKGKEESIRVEKNKYASPQILVYAVAKDEEAIIKLINKRGKEIIQTFKNEDIKFIQNIFKREKVDENQFETIKNLGIAIDIPKRFKKVDDTGDFLWLRQRLKSGIARGDGTNNILIYSVPFEDETKVEDNITAVRDTIGKKHIPGSKEGMYMITEQAYTPFTYATTMDNKNAYETRGKWEVKNDFMAGPFLNYTIVDKQNKRLVIFEGFTYAPSVNKRDFLFELEAIAKSMKIK